MHWKLALLAIFIVPMAYCMQISEVMYDPQGSDSGNEWIELYNNDSEANITGWRLDISGNHTLNEPPANGGSGSMVIAPAEYFVIAQDAASFAASYNFSGTVIDSSWGDMTNSANKTILIKNSSVIFDNVTYFPISAEGNSTCLINDSFAECVPTPGVPNIWEPAAQTNQTENQSQFSSNATCDVFPEIKTDYIVYSVGTIGFDIFLNDTACQPKNVTLTYDVEDLFGTAVKQPITITEEFSCTKTIARQWTPSAVQGTEAYEIKTFVIGGDCNGTLRNASKIIIIVGTQPQDAPSISIDDINIGSDGKIKYGETGEVSLTIYKGNTTKTAVNVFVEDSSGAKISETTNMNLNNKYTEYSISAPLRMKANCNGLMTNGDQTLIIEGLDIMENSTIHVEGISDDTCETITQIVSSGGSGGSSSSSSSSGSVSAQAKEIASIYFNDTLYAGEEISVTVNISNTMPYSKSYTIYSYIFRGQNPVSLGYDEKTGSWKGTYTANEKNMTLGANKAAQITFRNIVEEGTETGDYNLRVRVKSGTETNDVTRTVKIIERPKSEVTIQTQKEAFPETKPEANKTEPRMEKQVPITTGLATAKPYRVNYFQIIFSPLGKLFAFFTH